LIGIRDSEEEEERRKERGRGRGAKIGRCHGRRNSGDVRKSHLIFELDIARFRSI
jgi:hypothetical protein